MSINPYDPPNRLNSQNGSIQEPDGFDSGLLRYTLDIDDFLAFYQIHFRNSRFRRYARYLAVIVPLIVIVYLKRHTFAKIPLWANLLLLTITVFIAISAIFVTKFLLNWLIAFHLRRMLKEGGDAGLLGPHELEITLGFLIERTDASEHRQLLSKLVRIVDSEEHVFIYISSFQAHVIPKRRIQQGNLDAFLQRLRNAMHGPS